MSKLFNGQCHSLGVGGELVDFRGVAISRHDHLPCKWDVGETAAFDSITLHSDGRFKKGLTVFIPKIDAHG